MAREHRLGRLLEDYKKDNEESVKELKWLENKEEALELYEIHLEVLDKSLEQDLSPQVVKRIELYKRGVRQVIDSLDEDLEEQQIKVNAEQAVIKVLEKLVK